MTRGLAVVVAAGLVACTNAPARGARQAADEGAPDAPDAGVAVEPAWAARYYDAYLAETLRGDVALARDEYRAVVEGAGVGETGLRARAALRLAELEALAGHRGAAVDWLARASVLGASDPELVERADRLRGTLAPARGQAEVRGPPVGSTVAGASAEASARFARAEQALAAYQGVRLAPRLEDLQQGLHAKEAAMDEAVRSYRAVIATGEPPVEAAAEFRIGSLYHDLAVSLVFDLPPELEAGAAARLRRSLRANAIAHLRRARAAYERCQAAGAAGDRWRVAAELALRSVDDLLRGAE